MIRKLIGAVVTAIICTGAVSAAGLAVAPCAQCHADGKVLGENHPSVAQAKTLDDCMMCHQKAAPALSAMLHAKHTEKAPCSMCHEVKDGKLFNELHRGEDSRREFFGRIIEVVTLLGGELNDVL